MLILGVLGGLVVGGVGGMALARSLPGVVRQAAPAARDGGGVGGEPEELDLAAVAADSWARAERGRSWQTSEQRGASARGAGAGEEGGMVERAGAGGGDPAVERARLVQACADLADRLRDRQPGLYAVLARDLEAVGVSMQLADGEPFDVVRHNPVGTEATSDPGRHLRIASTMRVGYFDHGEEVRAPDVIVYRCEEAVDAG